MKTETAEMTRVESGIHAMKPVWSLVYVCPFLFILKVTTIKIWDTTIYIKQGMICLKINGKSTNFTYKFQVILTSAGHVKESRFKQANALQFSPSSTSKHLLFLDPKWPFECWRGV